MGTMEIRPAIFQAPTVPRLVPHIGGGASSDRVQLTRTAETLTTRGVAFRRHKKFLFFTLKSWKEATPSDVARLVSKGRTVQVSTNGAWTDVCSPHDLSLLDAFHGSGVPTSLPHGVLAQTLLGMERAAVHMEDDKGNPLGAYGAYKALAEEKRPMKIDDPKGRGQLVRSEEDARFVGFLSGQADPATLASPAVAASVKLLDDRQLDLRGTLLEMYNQLRAAPPTDGFEASKNQVALGKTDVATLNDPKRFQAWLSDREAELGATQAAMGKRALEAWTLLRQDGDGRPFAERLDALDTIFKRNPRNAAALYQAVLESGAPLPEAGRDAGALLDVLGGRFESRAPSLFAQMQARAATDRPGFVRRVGAVLPVFETLLPLLEEGRHDEALQTLIGADDNKVDKILRIAGHVHGWTSEGTWKVSSNADGTLHIADNTSGQYANNTEASLTSAAFPVPPDSRLQFAVQYGLEQNYDYVDVEISPDGSRWDRLKRYTGRGSSSETLDLSPHGGQTVQLRFHLHSDGSNTDSGIRIDRPVLESVGTEVRLGQHLNGNLADYLLGHGDETTLDVLARLSEKLDDAYGAAAVLSLLSGDLGAADLAERIDALCAVVREMGHHDALSAWPAVMASRSGSLSERVERLRAARALTLATAREPKASSVVDLYRKLDAAATPAAQATRMVDLAGQARAFQTEGTWAEVAFEGGRAWTDSPNGNYADNIDHSVTSAPLSLMGLSNAKLACKVKHDLEQSYDNAYLEVSPADGVWERLATFTGKQAAESRQIDLSAYDGQIVRLRMRIKTDGSNSADGIYFGDLRVKADGYDASLEDHLKAPVAEQMVNAATDTKADPAIRAQRLDGLATLAEGMHSVHDACLLWPLLEKHVGNPGFDEKVSTLLDLQKAFGTAATMAAWPKLEAAGPADFRERYAMYVAARRLADTLYRHTRAQRAADIYAALARVGADRALADSLAGLATRGQPWIAEGTWGRVSAGDGVEEWQDSPNAPYADNANMSLTSQTFSLAGRKDCRLRFDAHYDFEQNYDYCAVEVSDDDKSWREVAHYTGKGEAHDIDLSRYDGRHVQVRFRVHSDGSNAADGISLRNMRIQSSGAPVTDLDDLINGPLSDELMAAATAPDVDLSLRSRNLQAVARMTDALGSTQKAALIWPLLAPFQKSDDFVERADALTALARVYGVQAAFKMWPAVTDATIGPRLLTDRVDLLRASHDVASLLYRDTTLDNAVSVYNKLAASGADKSVFDTLGALIRSAPAWKSDGVWQQVTDDRGRPGFDDSPNGQYGDNLDSSITSAPFSLSGLSACKLQFDARWALEQNYDKVFLEASENGRDWHELAQFTGQGDGAQSVDLDPYCGRSLQLRWRIHTDRSNHNDGFRAFDLRLAVVDAASGARVEAALDDAINGPLTNELLDAATDASSAAADRARSLQTVERLATHLGSVQAAASLWPVLAPHLQSREFDAIADAAAGLASRIGVAATMAVLPVLQNEGTGSLAQRVQVYDGAHALAQASVSPSRVVDASLDVYRKLAAVGANGDIGKALVSAGDRSQAWTAEGTWGRERLGNGAVAWSDSPQAKYLDNTDASLTSSAFHVGDAATLTFVEQHVTEATYDFCALEISRDGKKWDELARYTGTGSATSQRVDLSAYKDADVQIRFRMHSDGSNVGDGISIWDIKLNQAAKSVPLEDLTGLAALQNYLSVAADTRVPVEERAANLQTLHGLPPGWSSRVMACHAKNPDVPLSQLLMRVMEGIPLGSDLESSLARALMPSRKEGKVELREEEVVVGGIRVKRRAEGA
jgi:hypothetical protein